MIKKEASIEKYFFIGFLIVLLSVILVDTEFTGFAVKNTGTLFIEATKDLKDAKAYVIGSETILDKKEKSKPISLNKKVELKSGNYKLTISKKGYQDYTKNVKISKNKENRLKGITLNKKPITPIPQQPPMEIEMPSNDWAPYSYGSPQMPDMTPPYSTPMPPEMTYGSPQAPNMQAPTGMPSAGPGGYYYGQPPSAQMPSNDWAPYSYGSPQMPDMTPPYSTPMPPEMTYGSPQAPNMQAPTGMPEGTIPPMTGDQGPIFGSPGTGVPGPTGETGNTGSSGTGQEGVTNEQDPQGPNDNFKINCEQTRGGTLQKCIAVIGGNLDCNSDGIGEISWDNLIGWRWGADKNPESRVYWLCNVIPDFDLDGYADAKDNCPYISDEYQKDNDNDGIGDVCDNCPEKINVYQDDYDLDGIGNSCDDDKGVESCEPISATRTTSTIGVTIKKSDEEKNYYNYCMRPDGRILRGDVPIYYTCENNKGKKSIGQPCNPTTRCSFTYNDGIECIPYTHDELEVLKKLGYQFGYS